MLHSKMLRYLDEVVRAGSIRRAAEKLNVASSSVNRQIIELEAELGTPIFDRLPRRLRLTAAGEVLIAHIRRTLRDHDKARFRIGELEGVGRGIVRLATMNGLASGLMPRLTARFAEQYPGVRFEVRSLVGREIVRAVDEGEADFGLGYNLPDTANLQTLAAFDAPLGVVAAPTHPLARERAVRLSDCVDHPAIVSDETLSIRRALDAACARASIALDAPFVSGSVEMMKMVAATGEAITFLSAPDVEGEVAAGRLVFLPLNERFMAPNRLSIVQRANSPMTPSPRLFIETVRAALAELAPLRQPA